jgi:hypothetical protein
VFVVLKDFTMMDVGIEYMLSYIIASLVGRGKVCPNQAGLRKK